MNVSRTVALGRAAAGLGRGADSDRELLRLFTCEGDQAAFEALVQRHAGMVLGVCRRALPTLQDAEDACQATFLVLARRAKDGRWRESVANWLYTTARRVARNARVAAERRAKREERAAVPEAVEPVDRATGRELLAALDAALDRLPQAYREPLVLCYLEGLTHDAAAARLGVPRGTVGTRVDRGRKRLHAALVRAGLAPGAGLLALAAAGPAGAASPRLVGAVLAAVSGPVPIAIDALAKGAAAPGMAKPLACVLVALACAAALSAGLGGTRPRGSTPAAGAPPVAKAIDAKPFEMKGRVVGPDDKPVPGAKLFLQGYSGIVPAPQPAADADGRFQFTLDEDTRRNALVAAAPGYGLGWVNTYLSSPTVAPTLRLTADEPIRGKVVGPDGKPAAGVSVSIVSSYKPSEDKTLDRWLEVMRGRPGSGPGPHDTIEDYFSGFSGLLAPATSDRDGAFELRGLGRDRVAILRVTGPTVETHLVTVVTRKVERFPGHAHFANTKDDTVHGREPVLTVTPVPVTTGRVLDADGEPVPGTVLCVEDPRGESAFVLRAVAGRDGRFTLPGLPTGLKRLRVVACPPDGEPFHRVSRAVPDDAAERRAFDVVLPRGIPATVKVIDKTTRQPARARISYGVFPADNLHAKATPNAWHGWQWAPGRHERATTGSEFRIVVFPGKGLLAAQSARNWLVEMNNPYLSGGGAEAFQKHRDGDFLRGLSGHSLHVPMWNTLAEIDVPADAKEFTFTLELDRGLRLPVRLVDADGKSVAGAVNSGLSGPGGWHAPPPVGVDFTALALRGGERRRVMFVQKERKLAGTAVVVGGTKKLVEVRMEPWGEVKGRIVGPDGKPLAGRIELHMDLIPKPDPTGGSSPFSYVGLHGPSTDKDGRFHIPGLVPGLTYRWAAFGWKVNHKVGRTNIPDVVAKTGETIDLGDIVVRPPE